MIGFVNLFVFLSDLARQDNAIECRSTSVNIYKLQVYIMLIMMSSSFICVDRIN